MGGLLGNPKILVREEVSILSMPLRLVMESVRCIEGKVKDD